MKTKKKKKVDPSKWWDTTWNPMTGCTPCSPGCDHCWAAAMAHRFKRDFTPRFHTEKLDEPLKWRKPRVVFVGDTTDIWHEASTPLIRALLLDRVAQSPQHTFVFLTKRSKQLRDDLTNNTMLMAFRERCHNAFIGVTVCNQQEYDEKVPDLLACSGWNRWLCCEPLLRPIDAKREHLKRLHGVIVGAETGAGRRGMHPAWALNLRIECLRAGIPFFYKRGSNGLHTLDGCIYEETPWAGRNSKGQSHE